MYINNAIYHLPSINAVVVGLEARTQRHPVKLLSTYPEISWRCADGVEETLRLSGTFATENLARLGEEIAGEGLVIAELPDVGAPLTQAERTWTLSRSSLPAESHSSSDRPRG